MGASAYNCTVCFLMLVLRAGEPVFDISGALSWSTDKRTGLKTIYLCRATPPNCTPRTTRGPCSGHNTTGEKRGPHTWPHIYDTDAHATQPTQHTLTHARARTHTVTHNHAAAHSHLRHSSPVDHPHTLHLLSSQHATDRVTLTQDLSSRSLLSLSPLSLCLRLLVVALCLRGRTPNSPLTSEGDTSISSHPSLPRTQRETRTQRVADGVLR